MCDRECGAILPQPVVTSLFDRRGLCMQQGDKIFVMNITKSRVQEIGEYIQTIKMDSFTLTSAPLNTSSDVTSAWPLSLLLKRKMDSFIQL
jgi:hypothetical protein